MFIKTKFGYIRIFVFTRKIKNKVKMKKQKRFSQK